MNDKIMEFPISQSKLAAFDSMCPIEFKAKYITKEYPEFEGSFEMACGNYFETLVIGGGIGGAFNLETSPFGAKIKNSVYNDRVIEQAEYCKKFLKSVKGKILSRQEYIKETLTHFDGRTMLVEGTLDIRFEWSDGKMVIIDLKFTGDTENDFGKFAWGTPEKMDLTQIVHYALLIMLKYKLDYIPDGYYWVFDKDKDVKKKLIWCKISQSTIDRHIERLFKAHDELSFAIEFDSFQPNNTWENCSKCKAKCEFETKMPGYTIIEL